MLQKTCIKNLINLILVFPFFMGVALSSECPPVQVACFKAGNPLSQADNFIVIARIHQITKDGWKACVIKADWADTINHKCREANKSEGDLQNLITATANSQEDCSIVTKPGWKTAWTWDGQIKICWIPLSY